MTQALLVVDIQEGLFANEPRPLEIDAVIENINLLAKHARRAIQSSSFSTKQRGPN